MHDTFLQPTVGLRLSLTIQSSNLIKMTIQLQYIQHSCTSTKRLNFIAVKKWRCYWIKCNVSTTFLAYQRLRGHTVQSSMLLRKKMKQHTWIKSRCLCCTCDSIIWLKSEWKRKEMPDLATVCCFRSHIQYTMYATTDNLKQCNALVVDCCPRDRKKGNANNSNSKKWIKMKPGSFCFVCFSFELNACMYAWYLQHI